MLIADMIAGSNEMKKKRFGNLKWHNRPQDITAKVILEPRPSDAFPFKANKENHQN